MYYICITCMWLRWDFSTNISRLFVRFKIFIIFYNSSQRDKCIEETFIEFILILFMRYTTHITIRRTNIMSSKSIFEEIQIYVDKKFVYAIIFGKFSKIN